MKISEKLAQRAPGEVTYSFEYFCPKTEQGVLNLIDRIDLMAKLGPLFVDITWNAGGSSSSETTLELVQVAQNEIGADTCMHMTCTNMTVAEVDAALQAAYDAGCRNILALRGDPPVNRADDEASAERSAFTYAKDLVRHIRAKYGDEVSIGVAGYPEGHPEEQDEDLLVAHLKEKVDAGADFVVTQMFYDADRFVAWHAKVRAAGVRVPLVPGIMPVSGWASFLRRARWCQIVVPPKWMAELEPLVHDDAAVRAKGTELVAELCRELQQRTDVTHFHFYTMNLEKSPVMCLDALGLLNESAVEEDVEAVAAAPRSRLRSGSSFSSVRPIHWRNRPLSYVRRTSAWDEFPNGRWGDVRSPAFNELNELEALLKVSSAAARKWWGHPVAAADVGRLVQQYISRELTSLPWSEPPAASECDAIRAELLALNSGAHEWFTINSQPAVNGAPSTHPLFGWGPANGYVYQKAYVELMVSPKEWAALLPRLERLPHDVATFYALGARDGEPTTNAAPDEVNAVTWGVFPGKEIVQPTIVEGASFVAWRDEAFRIAHEWARCYPASSDSFAFLHELAESWVLVNVVFHDFHNAKGIFELLA